MRSKNLEVPRAEGKTKSHYVVEELWEGNEDLEEMTTEELEEELIEVKEGWTNERVEFEVQRRKNEVLRRQLLEREKDEKQAGSRQSNPPDRLGVAAPAKRQARQPAKELLRSPPDRPESPRSEQPFSLTYESGLRFTYGAKGCIQTSSLPLPVSLPSTSPSFARPATDQAEDESVKSFSIEVLLLEHFIEIPMPFADFLHPA